MNLYVKKLLDCFPIADFLNECTYQFTVLSTKSSCTLTSIAAVRVKTDAMIQTRIVLAFVYVYFTISTSVPKPRK